MKKKAREKSISRVFPSNGFANIWFLIGDKYLSAEMTQERRGFFKKWWREDGVLQYARWLWKRDCAATMESRNGNIVVVWALSKKKVAKERERVQTLRKKVSREVKT